MYYLTCLLVLLTGYVVSLSYVSIFYHRGLAHNAVALHPSLLRFVVLTGNWFTGLDPKAWVCMHRMHHAYSDGRKDPHSPAQVGILGIFKRQLHSYEKTIVCLNRGVDEYTRYVKDLDFPVNPLNARRLWVLPYLMHLGAGIAIAASTGLWLLGLAYFAGIMSHPLQGFLVNSFGHAAGPRNFDTSDDSRNNGWVALLCAGEGYQNNHHRYPSSARFSYRPTETDWGFGMCLLFEQAGWLEIDRTRLIPPYTSVPARRAA